MHLSIYPHRRTIDVRVSVRAVVFACCTLAGCVKISVSRRGAAEPFEATDTARVVAPGVVSTGHEFGVTLSPDARELFTVERLFKVPDGPPTLEIKSARFDGTHWSALTTAQFSGRWRDIDPIFSPDGRRLYFNSTRPGPGRDSAASDFDIWVIERTADGWSAPARLPSPINSTASESFASVAGDGTIYFTLGAPPPSRESRIVRSVLDGSGRYSAPETLSTVNATRSATNPFITPDGKTLFFVDTQPSGFGDSDLYVARATSTGWTAPRNLGPLVNTKDAEFAPSLSPDGRFLLFTRMVRGTRPPISSEDIMYISLSAVLAGASP